MNNFIKYIGIPFAVLAVGAGTGAGITYNQLNNNYKEQIQIERNINANLTKYGTDIRLKLKDVNLKLYEKETYNIKLSTDIENLNKQLSVSRADLEKLDAAFASKECDYNTLITQKAVLETQNAGYLSQIAELKTDKTINETEINRLQNLVNENNIVIATINVKLSEMQEQLNAAKSEIATLNTAIESQSATINALITLKDQNEAEITRLNAEVFRLECELNTYINVTYTAADLAHANEELLQDLGDDTYYKVLSLDGFKVDIENNTWTAITTLRSAGNPSSTHRSGIFVGSDVDADLLLAAQTAIDDCNDSFDYENAINVCNSISALLKNTGSKELSIEDKLSLLFSENSQQQTEKYNAIIQNYCSANSTSENNLETLSETFYANSSLLTDVVFRYEESPDVYGIIYVKQNLISGNSLITLTSKFSCHCVVCSKSINVSALNQYIAAEGIGEYFIVTDSMGRERSVTVTLESVEVTSSIGNAANESLFAEINTEINNI